MALARWQRTIVDDAGNILPSAQVTVRREVSGAPLAVLYSDRDGTVPLGNPFTADPTTAFAAFHTAGGALRIDVVSGSFSQQLRYVGVGTMAEKDAAAFALEDFLDFPVISEPAAPAVDFLRPFASDIGGRPRLAVKNSNGEVDVLELLRIGNVRNYGAVGDGSTDDTAAIQAAIAAQSSNSEVELWLPAGSYVLGAGGTLTFADQNVVIHGDGPRVSEILCTHADARVVFTDSNTALDSRDVKRLIVQDITFTKGINTTAGNGGTCINATWAGTGIVSHIDHAFFHNLVIQGDGSSRYWHEGIRLTDAGCVNWSNVSINNITPAANAGSGIVIERAAKSNITRFQFANVLIHNFTNGIKIEHEAAVQAGTIEGLYFATTEIFGCHFAILDDNDSDVNRRINGLAYVGSHAGCSRSFLKGGWLSNVYVDSCNFTLSATGGDGSAGGVPWIDVNLHFEVVGIENNRFFRSTTGTTIANCIEVPGGNETSKLRLVNNVFENWTSPLALKSGTMSRLKTGAIIGQNILSNTGTYGALGYHAERTWYVLAASGVAVSHTGDTNETALATIAVPGGLLGANGALRITTVWSMTNNANTKTRRIRLGGISGTAFQTVGEASQASAKMITGIHNRNSQASQIAYANDTDSQGITTTLNITGTINTANDQDIVITGNLTNAGDTITLESYMVELYSQV